MMPPILAPQDSIEIAATIGFGIARRALWSGERCTWFEAVPTMPTQNPATSMMAGPDVYGGTAGIGWFLAQAAARTGDALLRRTARGALRQAAARVRDHVGHDPGQEPRLETEPRRPRATHQTHAHPQIE